MMLVKHAEKSGPPPKEFTDAMAILSEEAVKAGTIRGSGGLAPTAQSTRVRLSSGQIKVTDGPFTESKEVIGGYAEFELKSKEEAIEGAVRFMELHKKHWPGVTDTHRAIDAVEFRSVTCRGGVETAGPAQR